MPAHTTGGKRSGVLPIPSHPPYKTLPTLCYPYQAPDLLEPDQLRASILAHAVVRSDYLQLLLVGGGWWYYRGGNV